MAFDSASSRMWTRFWNGSVWSAWDLIWSSARGSRSFGGTGAVRLADGALFQWGTGTAAADGRFTVTFPSAFANATDYQPTAIHLGSSGAMVIEDVSVSRSATQCTFRIFNDVGANSSWSARWHAIGN